ncbi:MAG: formate C-acetyltransferase [Deltaproteobacteria bacterium]
MQAWDGFEAGRWMHDVDVRDFIHKNHTPYEGDGSFLNPASEKTKALWTKCRELLKEEREHGGVLSVDTSRPMQINSHEPGYIDRDYEIIYGLQTDAPLKRGINIYGGIRTTMKAAISYGYEIPSDIADFFRLHRPTHNDGVFAVYTPEMKLARKVGIITGLPDSYGRGRIIGDYRRLALYGIDYLIQHKISDLDRLPEEMNSASIQHREEIYKQIEALKSACEMAGSYGFDISRPAANAREAVQWLYFGYLAAVKEQNGAAMSLGRVSTFLDIYLERDMKRGQLDEGAAQELIDQLAIKLRLVRHLRTPEYNELFAGDPNWITESIGGMENDGRTLVSKTSFRFLHTLRNLGPSPEPNMTILWSRHLPRAFLEFCAGLSIDTCALQYENDDLMRDYYGDDYAIACCVSAMRVGRETQLFGARCNMAKLLLYAINGGRDEMTGQQVGVEMPVYDSEFLDYDEVMRRLDIQMKWLSRLYVNTMNVIHFMHDRYAYESLQMALHDSYLHYYMAFGIAGLSVTADSLSAIRYGRVKPILDARGLVTSFETRGDFPCFGNDDDRVDLIAVKLIKMFNFHLQKHATYRNAQHTLSILTITSNVMYGKHTGDTPDGRKCGEALAPGANPVHGREKFGAIAGLNSLAKLPYTYARDGISLTFSIVPESLGKTNPDRITNLLSLFSGYFGQDAHHMNVNVLDPETLIKAMNEPEKYADLTIRVSGYAVHFTRLSRELQEEIIARTFYRKI